MYQPRTPLQAPNLATLSQVAATASKLVNTSFNHGHSNEDVHEDEQKMPAKTTPSPTKPKPKLRGKTSANAKKYSSTSGVVSQIPSVPAMVPIQQYTVDNKLFVALQEVYFLLEHPAN